jgi:hypothetical protein
LRSLFSRCCSVLANLQCASALRWAGRKSAGRSRSRGWSRTSEFGAGASTKLRRSRRKGGRFDSAVSRFCVLCFRAAAPSSPICSAPLLSDGPVWVRSCRSRGWSRTSEFGAGASTKLRRSRRKGGRFDSAPLFNESAPCPNSCTRQHVEGSRVSMCLPDEQWTRDWKVRERVRS